MELLRKIVCVGVALGLLSCAKSELHNIDHVNIIIRNTGTETIQNAAVKFAQYVTVGGTIIPDGTATHLFFDHPIPEMATVVFSVGGNESQIEIPTKSKVPLSAEGNVTIRYNINSNSREVTVELLRMDRGGEYPKLVPISD